VRRISNALECSGACYRIIIGRCVFELTRAQYSVLIQIKSGHIALNAPLYRMKKVENPRCENCWTRHGDAIPETVRHFLFECPEYNAARAQLDTQMGRDSRSLGALLASEKGTRSLLKYIGCTKRLRAIFGNVTPSPN